MHGFVPLKHAFVPHLTWTCSLPLVSHKICAVCCVTGSFVALVQDMEFVWDVSTLAATRAIADAAGT